MSKIISSDLFNVKVASAYGELHFNHEGICETVLTEEQAQDLTQHKPAMQIISEPKVQKEPKKTTEVKKEETKKSVETKDKPKKKVASKKEVGK